MSIYVSASSRLHALLTELMQADKARGPLRAGWSQVLGVPEDEVQFGQFGLPLVAGLLAQAADEAGRADENVGLPLRREFVDEWSKPVYTPGAHLDVPVHQQQVSPEALAYLHSVASVLCRAEDHAVLPEGDELTGLLNQVSELAESVEATTELPDDVRQALLRRIAQVRFAIENARVGGPDGVQEAVDLLLGATVVRGGSVPRATGQKILAVALAAYAMFSAGPTVQASLEAWPQVVETLTASSDEAGDEDAAASRDHR